MNEGFPEGWKKIRLPEVCYFQEGPGLRRWQYTNEGYPFLNIRCIKQGYLYLNNVQYISIEEAKIKYQHFALNEGDYVLSSSGTLGRMAKVKKTDLPIMLNTSVIRFRSTDETRFLNDFLPHYLQSKEFIDQITEESQGSAQVNFGPTHLKLVKCVFPPLPEQKKIAKILTSVDEVIETTETQINKLKDLKKGMMNELLTKGIGHTEFKDSPVGRIPVGWEVKFLHEISVNHDSKRIPIKSSERTDRQGKYPYYGASGIIDYVDGYIFDGEYILLGEDGENVVSRNLPLAFIASGKYWVNNHAHVISPKENIDIYYLCEYLESLDYADIASGSAQPKITQASLNKIKIAIPKKHEQQKIASILTAIDNTINQKQTKLTQTKNLKKSLMADLLTGRVRVTP